MPHPDNTNTTNPNNTNANPAQRPLMPLHHRASALHTTVAAGSAALLALLVTCMLAFGGLHSADRTYFAVESNSMVPAFARGDLVITRAVQQLQIGDMVTFRKYGRLVTHRIVALGKQAGTFQTRGDANAADDPWTITPADVVGRVAGVVHRGGYPLLALGTVTGRLLVGNAVLALLMLLAWAYPKATRVPAQLLHPASGYAVP